MMLNDNTEKEESVKIGKRSGVDFIKHFTLYA
jgi:hypothetical protein